METLQVINPRLYAGVIKKLKAQQKEGSTVLVLPFYFPFIAKKVKENIYNFFRIFEKQLLTNNGDGVIMNTEIKGSGRTLEAKYERV